MPAFSETILSWYAAYGRDLPWRRTADPYAIWLSEIILQQTRIAQGRAYWERFMERFPTVEALAQADEDEVLRLWQGLGYYSRARNLHAAARQIVAAGSFPDTLDGIRALKGVGDYTAAAIGSSISVTGALAPARYAASSTALRSTSVTPVGIQMTTRGLLNSDGLTEHLIKCRIIRAVTAKSAITPSRSGRTAMIDSGVLPIISLACAPTARTLSLRVSTATTDGSRRIIPLPRRQTRVFAVPRSIPISFENIHFLLFGTVLQNYSTPFGFDNLSDFVGKKEKSVPKHALRKCISFGYFFPVEPKPPAPRCVSLSSLTSTTSGVNTGAITICAIRSPGAMT